MARPSRILVKEFSSSGLAASANERSRWYAEQLEHGHVLFFERPPFPLSEEDCRFLTAHRGAESSIHKNVSYRPLGDQLRGFSDGEARQRVHEIMRGYSRAVTAFVQQFLPYGNRHTLDYASFRPLEEEGRTLPLHKRNDLLHVDAFPSRPTHGGRILRVFTNIGVNPRVWIVTDTFPELASRLAAKAGLSHYMGPGTATLSSLLRLAAAARIVPDRSPYDRFMLHFHDWLKENSEFQQHCEKVKLDFPPLSTWLVFTDGCPHAVLSGQYALEQTFIIPTDALVCPEQAPVQILKSIAELAS
jgi:hypothetical protein